MQSTQTSLHPAPRKHGLRNAWSNEIALARAARSRGDSAGEWTYLERAHILSQTIAGLHVRTHV